MPLLVYSTLTMERNLDIPIDELILASKSRGMESGLKRILNSPPGVTNTGIFSIGDKSLSTGLYPQKKLDKKRKIKKILVEAFIRFRYFSSIN